MSVYTINANTLGISEYTGWIPVELVSHNNTLLVLQTGGLSEHTGTTDDGAEYRLLYHHRKTDGGGSQC